jgi:hypothetical protein
MASLPDVYQVGVTLISEKAKKNAWGVWMRARVRVAVIWLTISAGTGLAGCSAVDSLSETTNEWIANGKSLVERSLALPEDAPDVTHSIAPEKSPDNKTEQKETSKSLKKKHKPLRKPRQQTAEPPSKPTSASAQAAQPQAAEPQPAPAQPSPQSRLKTFWPEAPASGTFSR